MKNMLHLQRRWVLLQTAKNEPQLWARWTAIFSNCIAFSPVKTCPTSISGPSVRCRFPLVRFQSADRCRTNRETLFLFRVNRKINEFVERAYRKNDCRVLFKKWIENSNCSSLLSRKWELFKFNLYSRINGLMFVRNPFKLAFDKVRIVFRDWSVEMSLKISFGMYPTFGKDAPKCLMKVVQSNFSRIGWSYQMKYKKI